MLVQQAEKTAVSADQLMDADELRRILTEAVDRLPPKCKTIYYLSRDEEMNNQEIADRLGISVKTVENQITIAIKKLKEFLQPYYDQIFFLFLFTCFF